MIALQPVAFDIETTGLGPHAKLTVAGLATNACTAMLLNTTGSEVDARALEIRLGRLFDQPVELQTVSADDELIATLGSYVAEQLDNDQQYLCGFNAETWRNGFDLPFLRTACARFDVEWPFPDFAYADVRSMISRFNTGDAGDLDTVHELLVGSNRGDPFEDSTEALAAFRAEDWLPLLRHNHADLQRTLDLAELAGCYVPKSDFEMKNLAPPELMVG